eukprot:Plantae.Rhodophyta-Purpureofilum_apyrenoidigerum.ctg36803.p1 GENE.Plantae.Rhodophyta-Purpureofilum_apyrenoidigerum.ctg36803~~Plantae.Rhodophyta-Purpureofilum_apyrenoidigerum.ctg36803.p1  ORF type:complete len:151 (-),score=25.86 Plantae.Rhodophyta-Purpureofilum_apyrenoidigerum.ctg36803:165-617(-)
MEKSADGFCNAAEVEDNGGEPTHYDVLGVAMDVDDAAIRQAYRRLSLVHHPDRTGSKDSTAFQKLSRAYEVLSDPELRLQYDLIVGQLQGYIIHDEAGLAAMDPDEPDTRTEWTLDCRCGGQFRITKKQICLGIRLACCDTCSLALKVTL